MAILVTPDQFKAITVAQQAVWDAEASLAAAEQACEQAEGALVAAERTLRQSWLALLDPNPETVDDVALRAFRQTFPDAEITRSVGPIKAQVGMPIGNPGPISTPGAG